LVDALENERARVEDGHAERPILEDLPKALLAVAPGAHRGLEFRLGPGQPFHQHADARERMLDHLAAPGSGLAGVRRPGDGRLRALLRSRGTAAPRDGPLLEAGGVA